MNYSTTADCPSSPLSSTFESCFDSDAADFSSPFLGSSSPAFSSRTTLPSISFTQTQDSSNALQSRPRSTINSHFEQDSVEFYSPSPRIRGWSGQPPSPPPSWELTHTHSIVSSIFLNDSLGLTIFNTGYTVFSIKWSTYPYQCKPRYTSTKR